MKINYLAPHCSVRSLDEHKAVCVSQVVTVDGYEINEEEFDW